MKVLLVCTSVEEAQRIDPSDSHYPMGLAYIHAYIKNKHKVKVSYLSNVPQKICIDNLKSTIRQFKPDIVGISVMTPSRVSSFELIEYLQTKNIKTVLGGIHATVMHEQLLKKYPDVIIVLGEGEVTFSELLNNLDNLDIVKGIAYYDNGVKLTEPRLLIEDLDALPFPEHGTFLYQGKTLANLLTSRGCPFKCNFCCLDVFSKRKVRFRSAENVVDEIEYIEKNYPDIKTIWLHDDTFMINKKRTIEICNKIIERGIKLKFICSARFKPISTEVVEAMERANFIQVLFGLESGADKVMKNMHKGLSKDDIRKAIELFKNSNIKITVFLIVGLPGETTNTIVETGRFVQELQKINYFTYRDINIAMVFPGAEIYDISKQASKLNDDYWLTNKDVPFYEVEHDYNNLRKMKELLSNIVSYTRVDTPLGRFYQREMIPYINNYFTRFGS